ncbi:MAG: SymE family type I addiction module toxin [Verrucomicrobiota bacterium]
MTRSLAVERTGDFFKQQIKPRIRLHGKWLEAAGFKPGTRVVVTLTAPGQLTLTSMK